MASNASALAALLLREYGAAVPGPKRQYGRLPRKKLALAVEYIQDQLDADLTVSGIAQAVGMSHDHFTRLFKESTGQSPHQYVVEARVRKAKELLIKKAMHSASLLLNALLPVGFEEAKFLCSLFARFRTTTTRGLRIPAARIRRDTFAYPDGAEPINDSQ